MDEGEAGARFFVDEGATAVGLLSVLRRGFERRAAFLGWRARTSDDDDAA
jgi:hypothetical protein